MEGTSSGPPATVSTAELAAQITELAGHLNAANRRWLALIAEFDRRRGWSVSLTRSCAHWLNWQCGIDMGAAREKVRALTRVAGPATEQVFLSIALHGTAHHVETIVRQYRRATEAAELARRGAEHVREVESRIGGHATLALDEFVEPGRLARRGRITLPAVIRLSCASPHEEPTVSNAASALPLFRLATAAAGALVLGAIVSGCASRPDVSGGWAQGAPQQGFSRVMVVGLSPDLGARCPFERFMVAQIRALGTTAIMSCEVMDPPTPLTREALEKAVVAQKADAVIVTKLVAQSWDTKTGGTMDTRGGGEYKAVGSGWATGYYGMYGVPVVYAEFETQQSVTELQGKVQVQTRVFSVAGPALVYEMDTTVSDITSTGTGLYQITEPIAKHLERAGLLQ